METKKRNTLWSLNVLLLLVVGSISAQNINWSNYTGYDAVSSNEFATSVFTPLSSVTSREVMPMIQPDHSFEISNFRLLKTTAIRDVVMNNGSNFEVYPNGLPMVKDSIEISPKVYQYEYFYFPQSYQTGIYIVDKNDLCSVGNSTTNQLASYFEIDKFGNNPFYKNETPFNIKAGLVLDNKTCMQLNPNGVGSVIPVYDPLVNTVNLIGFDGNASDISFNFQEIVNYDLSNTVKLQRLNNTINFIYNNSVIFSTTLTGNLEDYRIVVANSTPLQPRTNKPFNQTNNEEIDFTQPQCITLDQFMSVSKDAPTNPFKDAQGNEHWLLAGGNHPSDPWENFYLTYNYNYSSTFEITENSYCKCDEIGDKNKNFTTDCSYDITGKLQSQSIAYADKLGKLTQDQSLNVKTANLWVSQRLYDSQGRAAFQSLSAPTKGNVKFDYLPSFITNGVLNGTFNTNDFENGDILNPSTVGTQENTLGWYYSTQNTDELHQDITDRPYSRTIFSELSPGAVKQTIGGNKINGEWKQGYSFSMVAPQEMYYVFGYDYFPNNPAIANTFTNIDAIVNDGNKQITWLKVGKSVVEDVHGNEAVVFTDADGKTLAAARSGVPEISTDEKQYEVLSLIGEQKFTDIHIPKGCDNTATLLGTASDYKIYDLKTEQIVTNLNNAGFYRVEYIGQEILTETHMLSYIDKTNGNIQPVLPAAKGVRYKVNYYDYSINYYNDAGLLTSSVQPIGFNENSLTNLLATVTHNVNGANTVNATTTYQYNSLGQLLSTTSPDEGTANFKYRTDGQIRFSQNSKQQAVNEFSYTNYDELARPIESGVASGAFTSLNPDVNAFSGARKEQHFTEYDFLTNSSEIANLIPTLTDYHNPTFLSGNVVKTHNLDNSGNPISTTYYSYDNYGRVKWIVQDIVGLGVKTIDYVYDPVTSQVQEVDYQRHVTNERFIHKYSYNTVQELVSVETSTGGAFIKHADYTYYETGAIKRTEIAGGIQGIDYVYNLAGQLKSINHPNLTADKDPGNDADDFFGMSLDYYNGDYLRSTDFSFPTGPTSSLEQYNGNIKALTWNTGPSLGQAPVQYEYSYNKNNWLTQAKFHGGGNLTGILTEDIVINQPGSPDQTVQAGTSITFEPGFQVTAASGTVFVAEIVINNTGNPFDETDYKVSGITYDANGNIQSLDRNMNTVSGASNAMDKLRYTYSNDKPNQLDFVDDLAGNVGVQDIDAQTANNYEYNSIGQLVKNNGEDIEYEYNASGLVTKVKRTSTDLSVVEFFYNDKNFRTRKISYLSNGSPDKTTDYVRDASGSVLAIYENSEIQELPIYGASRLGVYNKVTETSVYQLTDHLGNVRAVIASDGVNAAALVSSTDYYPFGMPMPNRINGANSYRYGYQGEFAETDPETGKPAFELRLYDPRLGRWLSPDPMGQYHSPYMAMDNTPQQSVDPTGGSTDPDPCCDGFNIAGPEVDLGTFKVDRIQPSGINTNWSTEVDHYGFGGSMSQYMKANNLPSTMSHADIDNWWETNHSSNFYAWTAQMDQRQKDQINLEKMAIFTSYFVGIEDTVEAYIFYATMGSGSGATPLSRGTNISATSSAGRSAKLTKHGAERIAGEGATRGGVLTRGAIQETRALGRRIMQSDGAVVHILEANTGKFNIVIEAADGTLITTFRNISFRKIWKIARNNGWILF